MVGRGRIELPPERCKRPVLLLSLTAHKLLAREPGFEPGMTESKSVVFPTTLFPNKFLNTLLRMCVLNSTDVYAL